MSNLEESKTDESETEEPAEVKNITSQDLIPSSIADIVNFADTKIPSFIFNTK